MRALLRTHNRFVVMAMTAEMGSTGAAIKGPTTGGLAESQVTVRKCQDCWCAAHDNARICR